MSQENVEVVERSVEAYRRGDIDAVLEEVDDDVEFDFSEVRGPYRGIYRGREGVRQMLTAFRDVWASITPLSTEYTEVGDKVVLALRARFQGRGSGVEVGEAAWVPSTRCVTERSPATSNFRAKPRPSKPPGFRSRRCRRRTWRVP